ncbi:MAG TPA: PAS domain-containing protein [Alphaproteobacteria bacterium]|nr:PAS domain-containing protein [Alphaproteobacteria bacterium]
MPAIKQSMRFRNLPTALAVVTASVAITWLVLSAKTEYERDIGLGERQTQLLATGLQDTTERQFNEINREVITILGAVERQLAAARPLPMGLSELATRALDDDGDILRVIVRVDDTEAVNLSPMAPDAARIDTARIEWSPTETAFPFGFVNIGAPVALPEGGYTLPLRYSFVASAERKAMEIVALTAPEQILQGYQSVELADGSAFAVFRADGVLLTRWPVTPDFVGRKFAGPIFGHYLKFHPSATIRATIETDPRERIFTYRSARGWPLVVVAGVPVRGVVAGWLASLPGKSVLLLFILSAIFLLWVALRSSQSDLRRSVEQLPKSEGRYARLLSNIPGGVFTRRCAPPDNKIEYVFVSEGFRHAFGMQTDPTAPDTASLLDLVHPDDRRQMQDSILASREGDDVWTQEFRAIKPNGQLIWVQSVARRYPGEDGSIMWDGIAIDVTDVHQQQTLLESVQKIAGLGYWIWQPEPGNDADDQSRRHTRYSPACAAILGLTPADLQITDADYIEKFVHPEDRARVAREYEQFLNVEDAPHDIQYRILRPNGGLRWVHCTATKDIVGGKVVRIIGVLQDVTEAKLHETQIAQAQKMEAIGGLTGGVAHDFNNLLTVIIGNLEALASRLRDQPQLLELTEAAIGAAERGATLTKRLLAFARRQPLSPQPTDLSRLLTDLLPLLNRSVGPLIEVAIKAAPDLPRALVDPNQLENAILNLANNARDAMPRGGRLSISVDFVEWAAEEDGGLDAGEHRAAPYLRISVTDTGVGMTRETLERAVEPFFTTKPVGQGTGLGLSMVYGLAKQSRGHLRIYSEPGIGTTIRLFLPVATEAAPNPMALGDSAGDFAGRNALLVDDDPAVRATTAAMLRSLGFSVSEAPTGTEALRILEGTKPIDVLVTDVILAGGMLGPEVAQRARSLKPALKVLFISGFASDALVDHRPLLSKPFRRAELAAELGKLLG